jgi:UDP-glucose 4-epimerase
VATSPAELDEESSTWELFLSRLGSELDASPGLRSLPGRVFLASSAGGVYAGNPDRPLTESSAPLPVSPYGRAKLRQERALEEWAARRPWISTLTARISNLYGPGQNMSKPQGLISHMSRCLIHRQPVHIYVPMDTIRDYLFVEDAARAIVRWMERLSEDARRSGSALRVLKICASEGETTIAGLVGAFRQMAKRNLRVVSGLHPVRGQQPARLQFRSTVWVDEPVPARTGLLAGIDRLYRHQLALYQAGALPAPTSPRFGGSSGSAFSARRAG